MKKIFKLLMIIAIVCAMTLVCSAEELVTETAPASVFDRLWEWINAYTAEIAAGGGVTVMLVALIAFWKRIKPMLTAIVEGIKKIFSACNDAADVQDKHSGALNNIIDAFNKLDAKLSQLETKLESVEYKETQDKEHFKHIQESLRSFARLFDTVYSNSRLPQGTKDMVHVSCAECLKIAEREINGETEVAQDEQEA